MTLLDLAYANLLSPPVLCFALGAFAFWLRSDLALPEPVFAALSIYLMLSIGLRGGVELGGAHGAALMGPLLGALALGCVIPLSCFALLRRLVGLSATDAGAMAAHYGSVSAVTFAAVTALLDRQGLPYEGHVATLLAVMEVPAIIVGVGLAKLVSTGAAAPVALGGSSGGAIVLGRPALPASRAGIGRLLNEVLASKSVVLLLGGLAIGALAGPPGLAAVRPLFGDLFQGALCLFLLELGRVAAGHTGAFRAVGARLACFALVMPVVHGALGVAMAYGLGLSQGGAVILGTLAASASYIAAPAAVRAALPEANPGYYLTCSLAITFPFNIVIGLALYEAMAAALYR